MATTIEVIKKECTFCGKVFEINSVGETPSLVKDVFDTFYGVGLIGVNYGRNFICKDCFEDFADWQVKNYKLETKKEKKGVKNHRYLSLVAGYNATYKVAEQIHYEVLT